MGIMTEIQNLIIRGDRSFQKIAARMELPIDWVDQANDDLNRQEWETYGEGEHLTSWDGDED